MMKSFEKNGRNQKQNIVWFRSIAVPRKSSHMTQKELAEATGIDQSDISKIETGNANPALSTLMRLAEGMGMVLHLEFVPKQVR